MRSSKLIFLSDFHLVSNKPFFGLDTFSSLDAVISDILQNHPDAEYFILGGDLLEDLSVESFTFLQKQIARLIGCKLFIRGNHDSDDDLYKQLAKDSLNSLSIFNWEIRPLETYSKGKIHGEVSDKDFDSLYNEIKSLKDKDFIVCTHHNLTLTNSAWIDLYITKDYKNIVKKLSSLKNLKIVISGHVHLKSEQLVNGTLFLTSPSTSFQLHSNQSKFSLDKVNPGYVVIEISENNSYSIDIKRVSGHFGEPTI
jgi:3',5'-cyclic-AMP phosphodiesterase